MVKHQNLTSIFAALADPTRRRILERLSERRQVAVTTLARPFRMSPPAISRHLRVLERARLITRQRVGRTHLIRANQSGLSVAKEWIERYAEHWDAAFDALEALLRKHKEEAEKKDEIRD